MAKRIADLQVYAGKDLEATKKELESFGYKVETVGVAVCSFSSTPAKEKLPSVGVTPSDPNKLIFLTYNIDDSQPKVRTINQS